MSTLPVVNRFFWPPDIPLLMGSPTNVSAQKSRPSICKTLDSEQVSSFQQSDWNTLRGEFKYLKNIISLKCIFQSLNRCSLQQTISITVRPMNLWRTQWSGHRRYLHVSIYVRIWDYSCLLFPFTDFHHNLYWHKITKNDNQCDRLQYSNLLFYCRLGKNAYQVGFLHLDNRQRNRVFPSRWSLEYAHPVGLHKLRFSEEQTLLVHDHCNIVHRKPIKTKGILK